MTKPDAVKAVNKIMEKFDNIQYISITQLYNDSYVIYLYVEDVTPENLERFDKYKQVTRFLEGKCDGLS